MRIRHSLLVLVAFGMSCSSYDVAGNGRVWYFSCGDPVCTSYRPPTGVPRCTSESPGQSCSVEGSRCDPMDSCNRLLVCAQSDPRLAGCPISSRRFKRDVAYLTDAEREACAREVRGLRLARYRYEGSDEIRLGFILEDHPPAVAVDRAREQVDLYGYSSLAVAALQAQDRRLEALEREVRELRAALSLPRAAPRPPRPAPGP